MVQAAIAKKAIGRDAKVTPKDQLEVPETRLTNAAEVLEFGELVRLLVQVLAYPRKDAPAGGQVTGVRSGRFVRVGHHLQKNVEHSTGHGSGPVFEDWFLARWRMPPLV